MPTWLLPVPAFTGWNEVDVAAPHTAHRDQHLRERGNGRGGATQHHGLQAMVVVQVGVQAGDDEIVVGGNGEALRGAL
jgi:hypothetical protein